MLTHPHSPTDWAAAHSPLLQGDLARVPGLFSAARHEDVLAAVDLTEGGFGGRRRRAGATGLSWPVVKLVAQLAGHKLLPGLVPRPALMTLNDTTTGCGQCVCEAVLCTCLVSYSCVCALAHCQCVWH